MRHTKVESWNCRLRHRAGDEDDADDDPDNSEPACGVHRLAEHPFAHDRRAHRPMIGINTLASQPHLKSSIVPTNCAGPKATVPLRPQPPARACPLPRLFVGMTGVWRQTEGWWMALSSHFRR
jgi:hypothetical protein